MHRALIAVVVVLFFSSCDRIEKLTCPEICFSTVRCGADTQLFEEIDRDLSHFTDEELEEEICNVYREYVANYSESRRFEQRADAIFAHDQLFYRRNKQFAAEAATAACILENYLRQLNQEMEVRNQGKAL